MTFIRRTLSDLKNGLPPRALATRLHGRGLVFVHVPKCAGTSIETALREHYRLSRIIIDPEASFRAAQADLACPANDQTRQAILSHASEMRRTLLHAHLATGYHCITGHAPLGLNTLKAHEKSHDFITILREPVARFLSHLTFNLAGHGGHGRIDEPLENFLRSPRAKTMGSLYGKYFSGLPMSADFTSPEAVEAATHTLTKMNTVGRLDQLNKFSADIEKLTGKRLRITHKNKTASNQRTQTQITPEATKIIESLCAADSKIYRWVCEEKATAPAKRV